MHVSVSETEIRDTEEINIESLLEILMTFIDAICKSASPSNIA